MQASAVPDVQWWIQQLSSLTTAGKCAAPQFLKPYHFVTTALTVKRSKFTSLNLPENLTNYAIRMHLWEAAGLPDPTSVTANPEGKRFLPVEALRDRNAVATSASKLALIAGNNGADAATVNSLETALMEILENCFAHAQMNDELWGLACAQTWPKGNKAQIAIADSGVGIRNSLLDNPLLAHRLAEENSCEMATQYGVTGKPGKGHSGYGLTLSRQLLEGNGGTLIIVSHDEYFCSSNGHTSSGKLISPWLGTVVMLEWNTDRPLDVTAVYNGWPLPEGMIDGDFDL